MRFIVSAIASELGGVFPTLNEILIGSVKLCHDEGYQTVSWSVNRFEIDLKGCWISLLLALSVEFTILYALEFEWWWVMVLINVLFVPILASIIVFTINPGSERITFSNAHVRIELAPPFFLLHINDPTYRQVWLMLPIHKRTFEIENRGSLRFCIDDGHLVLRYDLQEAKPIVRGDPSELSNAMTKCNYALGIEDVSL